MTKWKNINSKKEYNTVIKRINELMDVKRTDAIHNELILLSFLVEDYEGKFHKLPDASPSEVIRFAMEMKGIKQQELIPVLGTKGNVSKILSSKAKLQLDDIHPLSVLLGIPAESLIPRYEKYTEPAGVMADYIAEPSKPVRKTVIKMMEPRVSYRSKQTASARPAAIKKSRPKIKK
ncbi:MAG: hypothetical protein ABIQ11_00330 [Saprospiraceae bacterium]